MKFRTWHVPQIPGKPFIVECETKAEADRMSDVLSSYDIFQYEENIKPDFANAGGVEEFVDGEWIDVEEDW